jgi:hypothetical protein
MDKLFQNSQIYPHAKFEYFWRKGMLLFEFANLSGGWKFENHFYRAVIAIIWLN